MLTELLSGADAFVATFSRPLKNSQWTKAVVRAEREDGRWRLRVESFTTKQSFTAPSQEPVDNLDKALSALLADSFRQILVQTPSQDVHVLRSFKHDRVEVAVKHAAASRTHWDSVTSDRVKQRLLAPSEDCRFLHLMGLASENGQILTAMADKFRQVNHLLARVVSSEQRAASSEQRAESSEQRAVSSEQRAVSSEQRAESSEFVIVDAGCGKAYLSLSLMYVLERMGRKVRLIGIDSNEHVIRQCEHVAREMGFTDASFVVSDIRSALDIMGVSSCDLLIALHACDTATDQAIELGLRLSAERMLIAPCCHHYVQKQLHKDRVPESVRPLLDDGITKERLGDLVTDTMRRDILRWKGYDAHLEEFISQEHTQKNILLSAQRLREQPAANYWHTVVANTVEAWGVHCALWASLNQC
jgi:hypothetical protein